ncbi:hypothetical protein [Methylicorpusculum oleiharenae]|nr:hypothetical protein [Methylicorpusculum oleiharenae]
MPGKTAAQEVRRGAANTLGPGLQGLKPAGRTKASGDDDTR